MLSNRKAIEGLNKDVLEAIKGVFEGIDGVHEAIEGVHKAILEVIKHVSRLHSKRSKGVFDLFERALAKTLAFHCIM